MKQGEYSTEHLQQRTNSEMLEQQKSNSWTPVYPKITSYIYLTNVLFSKIFSCLYQKNVSMTILSLPLIQEEQLSVTGKRMGTKYW